LSGPTQRAGVKHGALVEFIAVLAPAVERGVKIGQSDFGEEAEEAEIHAEYWRSAGGEDARNGEQGSVSAEDDDQGWSVSGKVVAIDGGRGAGVFAGLVVEDGLVAALTQPGNQLREQASEFFFLRLADYRDSNHAVSVYRTTCGGADGR